MEYVTAGGARMPALGLGTYKLRGRECTETVLDALAMGYRHIDTAEYYNNQQVIGHALEKTDVPREELFLTTKIWRSNLAYEDALASARESIDKLGVEAVDLLLIHWPSGSVPTSETIEAMNELQSAGRVEHIGVSNFSVGQLEEAIEASETPIVANQVEYHPYERQAGVLEYCIENGVICTAYSPLAKGKVVNDETLQAIGEQYDKSPAQVALRWLIQQEQVAAIPKASSVDHLEANREIFDFSLTDDEMERIFELQGGLLDRVQSLLGF